MMLLGVLLTQAAPADPCRYERAAMLALEERAFDQDGLLLCWEQPHRRAYGCGVSHLPVGKPSQAHEQAGSG